MLVLFPANFAPERQPQLIAGTIWQDPALRSERKRPSLGAGWRPRGGRGEGGLLVGEVPEPHTHNPAQLMETHSALVLLQTLVTGTASPQGPNARLFCPEPHQSNAGGLVRSGRDPESPQLWD